MPVRETNAAQQAASTCDAFLVVGSSLQVHPAASMPLIAKQSGAGLAIVNLEPTPLDRIADVVWNETAGAALTAIVRELKIRMAGAN
jgi:NAD-dependent deacetylase